MAAVSIFAIYIAVTVIYVKAFPAFPVTAWAFLGNLVVWTLAFALTYLPISLTLAWLTYPLHGRAAWLAGCLAIALLVTFFGWPFPFPEAPIERRLQLCLQTYAPIVVVIPVFLGSAQFIDRIMNHRANKGIGRQDRQSTYTSKKTNQSLDDY